MENSQEDLAKRVDDIEKTIGDFAQVINVFKSALIENGNGGSDPFPIPPTCPPYCAHRKKSDFIDDLPLTDRVADIRQWIGDFGAAFEYLATLLQSLRQALEEMPPPTCPPYCVHPPGKKGY
ncbi:MAG: hypothetical protein ABR501_00390 [Pyrinomonadaceae bacterium]